MLFAAGKGTRLRPLTDHTPKCLVQAGGKTLLEHNIAYLKSNGVDSIVINTHHHADQVHDFLQARDFGLEIFISHENELLETGGGLLKARAYFEDEPSFVVCNSDIYTDFDLKPLISAHHASQNLATLVVSKRETSRYLRFNASMLLCGWEDRKTAKVLSWSDERFETWAFNGIQMMSPGMIDLMKDRGEKFSTIPVYLDAAERGERVAAYPMSDAFWIDIGTKDKLDALNSHLQAE